MNCPDVNVLVYAHREDFPDQAVYAAWLTRLADGPSPFAVSELVLSGFLRIVTNRRVFRDPTPLAAAVEFVQALCAHPGCRPIRPGPRHFDIFLRLCRESEASGKLVADAYHAAVAIEHGATWVTADSDFARFPDLAWRHPLSPSR